jgi:hypothetical protein
MNELSTKNTRPRPWLQGAAVLAALVLILVAGAGSMSADSPNQACIRDANGGTGVWASGNVCTANDVRVGVFIAPPNPPPCVLNSTVTIPNLTVKVVGPTIRHGLGGSQVRCAQPGVLRHAGLTAGTTR